MGYLGIFLRVTGKNPSIANTVRGAAVTLLRLWEFRTRRMSSNIRLLWASTGPPTAVAGQGLHTAVWSSHTVLTSSKTENYLPLLTKGSADP